MPESDKIELKGMRFYGYHGVEKEEKALGQWFEIDLVLWGDFSAAMFTDKVENTVDYSQVYEMTREIVEGEPVNLLEHLASRIMNSILPLPLVEKVLVRVKKPLAPVKGPLDYAGVEIVRCKYEG